MPFKANIKSRGGLQRTQVMQKTMEAMKRSRVTVGVHEDAGTYEPEDGEEPVPVSKVAFWVENGTRYMPARPFFYPALANNEGRIQHLVADAAARVIHGGSSIEHALGMVGFAVQAWIQNVIKSNVGPGLGWSKGSAAYLKRRLERFPDAGTRTLIASGLLLRSVRYKVIVDGAAPETGPEEGPAQAQTEPGKSHQHPGGAEHDAAAGRARAREAAAGYKAEQRRQKEYAKDNPEKTKEAFNKQHRAFPPYHVRKPK